MKKIITIAVLFLAAAAFCAADDINLVSAASKISWRNSDGTVLTFGADGGAQGTVKYLENPVMEDGKLYSRGLFIHPPWKSAGKITGVFPDISIPSEGAVLRISMGILKGAKRTDGVTLSLSFIGARVPGERIRTKVRDGSGLAGIQLCSQKIILDGKLEKIDCDLKSIAGQEGSLILILNAGGSADEDWGLITEAVITSGSALQKADEKGAVLIHSLKGHSNRIYWAEFSPNGRYIMTGSGDGTVRLWDVQSGRMVKNYGNQGGHVFCASFSPDGKYLAAAGGNTVNILAVPGGAVVQKLVGHSGEVHSARFSPDGKRVVTTAEDGTARIWQVDSGKELSSFQVVSQGWTYHAVFKPGIGRIAIGAHDGLLEMWDVPKGKKSTLFSGHNRAVNTLQFNRQGHRLLSAAIDSTARLWNADSGALIRTFGGPQFDSAAFSPDERKMISGNDNGRAIIWDISSGKQLMVIKHSSGDRVRSAAFSPDGKKVVTAGEDGVAKIWEIRF